MAARDRVRHHAGGGEAPDPPRWIGEAEQIDEGVLLRAHADDLDAAARMLASLGWPFTVRAPDELRDALRKIAEVVFAAAG
jgi:predicted DNA-binding transcriptional regulator YafY